MLAVIPASPAAIGTVRTYGVGFLGYGLIVALQGQQRWSSASLTTANDLVEWLPWPPSLTWGWLFAATGVAILAGSLGYHFGLRNTGIYGSAFLIMFLGLTAMYSATQNPSASFAGGFLYVLVGAAICWVARAREVRPDVGVPQGL